MPRFFTAGIQRFTKISTSRPDSQAVRCASVFNLVHRECPFREKRLPLPAQRQRNNRTTARQHDFSVSVIQLQIKLVRFKAPVIRQRQTHQAVIQHSGDIPALNTDAEALIDALLTGRNQIFLSASKAQAHVFKQYIIDFAKEVEVELKGDPMVLPNGATLYFLGTNARTAQSYHGNLYLDEYFWIPKFQELRKVASGMAIHKKWRQTYFSTPSSLTHSAYPFWSGALFNRGRNKADKVDIDLSHSNLAPGLLCADGQYRQIVTVEDAVRGGCNLFDLDQLRMEYSPDEYQNLLMCEFVDDLASVFPLSELQACMVDSWEVWTDFHALALRPFGWREVWIGYDPAKGTQNGDSAGCVVVAPPAVPGGKFRILERHQWRGMDFRAQADAIKKLTEQYNVTYIGIDSTGVGHGVYENVKAFFPAVREFVYNPNVKNALVLKAYDIISHRRLEFDAGHTDIAQSFMAIRRATTASGNRPTYEASRSEEASHADLAWATMHALFNEPLQGESANTSNIVEIF